MSYESRKGYESEHKIENLLRHEGFQVDRPRAGRPQDRGDIVGLPLVISVKDHARLELSTWVDEMARMTGPAQMHTGVVWHKRKGKSDPRNWYVTTRGDLFLPLLHRWVI